ncbi:hypothetical protein [Ochrobactrum sp. A-1]|uniref:hypothetical protein n=1 Tax=Ochrobactrum sp. A-1 TaxID=2920940 RepID=UPI001F0B4F58|nr:hypothetical protein [Ochrobactrum sp. A-1]
MGQIWVREFLGGLDRRRMSETTSGGILVEAIDGHITRGGEFEKRAAFVNRYQLPAGTVGLAYTRTGLVVFGSGAAPAMPVGVRYQRLQHPAGTPTLISVKAFDLFGGKIYAIGVFSDGTTHHFYNGVRVTDWNDTRARAILTVTGGGVFAAVSAQGTVTITGGMSGAGNAINALTVNGVAITNGPVSHTGDNVTTATALAEAINEFVSTPDYSATASGNVVTVKAVTAGAASNGYVIQPIVAGSVTATGSTMAGGVNASTSVLNNLTIGGVAIIGQPVFWTESHATTAAAIAEAINAFPSDPEYTALTVGATIIIQAADSGTAGNGKAVTPTVANGLSFSPSSTTTSGGAEPGATFTPGNFARTIGAKMYVASDENLHFSMIKNPTKWTTGNTGAGFIDMSMEASGSEQLTAVAKYQNMVAVFSAENVLVWYMDPDPNLNKLSQVLNNTGTSSARSVTQFGDDDIFYLDTSGIRSLRARDASNAASTTDIGSPIDPIVAPIARTLTADERTRVFGGIEPTEGRFWLAIKDTIFVFSYFSGAKVSAWTMYKPGFNIDEMVVWNRRVYVRSGNNIYVYGGDGVDLVYDNTEAVARLPYLDADAPTRKKTLSGHDAAAEGRWEVSVSMDPNFPDVPEVLGNVIDTTYVSERLPAQGASTHFSFTYRSKGPGPAKLGAIVIHYDAAEDND